MFFKATDDELCPVRVLTSFVAWRGVTPGPFFCTATGGTLIRARFVEHIRSAVARAGTQLIRSATQSICYTAQ